MITTLLFTVGIILPFEWSGLKALRGGTLKGVSALVTDNDVEYGAWFLGKIYLSGVKMINDISTIFLVPNLFGLGIGTFF